MISDNDLAILKQFIFSKEYRILEQVVVDMTAELDGRSKVQSTEWGTTTTTLLCEGEKQGLLRLLQQLNELASKSP